MKTNHIEHSELIEEYQCSGCVGGPFPDCYEKASVGLGCKNHCAGTMITGIGRIFLGMPKGFNRIGFCDKTDISIFTTVDKEFEFNKLNIPIWKYIDKLGNTIVRGMSPRINFTWIHIYIGDVRDKIDCIEITDEDLLEWD